MRLCLRALALLLAAACAPPASATETLMANFEKAYPAAAGTRIDACILCHTAPPERNSYGNAFKAANLSFAVMQSGDADGDGFSNLAEINARTFPGNASETPSTSTGSLTVTILPAEAVTAGAQWRVGPGGAYQNSGATVTGLAAGEALLQFKAVSGWTAPADQTGTIVANRLATATGTYTRTQIPAPNLVGQTLAAAGTMLSSAGLVFGVITQQHSPTVPAGNVISQTPAAGTPVNAGASVALVVSLGPALVTVPNVVGKTQAAANTTLTAAGLTVGVITQVYSDTVPSGQVIGQTPTEGVVVIGGSAVALTVSKGPEPVTVPNVVGQTQAEAATAITAAGLVVGAVTQRHDATVPEGMIISQSPAAGAGASPGSAVGLLLSQGPGPVTVPSVTGQTQAAAATLITGAGLVVGEIVQEYSATVPAGRVASQTPAANTEAEAGSAMALVVSLGPQPMPVPNVEGLTQEEAAARIAAAGLTVGQVTEASNDTVPAGTVISQTPAAGTQAPPSSPVNLTVSSGPESAGCACVSTGKGAFSIHGLTKTLGDLFLVGLSLATLRMMARRKM